MHDIAYNDKKYSYLTVICRNLRHTVIGFSGMIQVLVWVECVHIDLGWIYDCIIDYSLVRDSKNKNLIMTT